MGVDLAPDLLSAGERIPAKPAFGSSLVMVLTIA